MSYYTCSKSVKTCKCCYSNMYEAVCIYNFRSHKYWPLEQVESVDPSYCIIYCNVTFYRQNKGYNVGRWNTLSAYINGEATLFLPTMLPTPIVCKATTFPHSIFNWINPVYISTPVHLIISVKHKWKGRPISGK